MAVLRIPLKFIERHTPCFYAGKNFAPKIDAQKEGVTLTRVIDNVWNKDEVHITGRGDEVGIIPFDGNISIAYPVDAEEAGVEKQDFKPKITPNPIPQAKVKAQVSAPAGIKI